MASDTRAMWSRGPASEACQRSSQLWMNIHGGAPVPKTLRRHKMCACWSGTWLPAACWPLHPPQMSWLCSRVSATVMSRDTAVPPDWPLRSLKPPCCPVYHLEKNDRLRPQTFAKVKSGHHNLDRPVSAMIRLALWVISRVSLQGK